MPELSDLKLSEETIGQIYPVVKDAKGNILDGFHRKRANPNWKEISLPIDNPLMALSIRIHLNDMRRSVPASEKQGWVKQAREILSSQNGHEPTQQEIANHLGYSRQWVTDYDVARPTIMPRLGNIADVTTPQEENKATFNVWGFKDNSWRQEVVSADPTQPDVAFYHGSTPAFVIHNLIQLYKPKAVLDSMAGMGTTGHVCRQYNISCDLFDIYPFEKHGVQQSDAEYIQTGKTYDLIFNHIPYLDMVVYGENQNDLSNMNETQFMEKMQRIFLKNRSLLNKDGVFTVLVGDKRFGGKLVPLIAKITQLGIACDFTFYDEAVKLTREQKSSGLLEFRAAKFGYMAQTFDMVLIFKKGD